MNIWNKCVYIEEASIIFLDIIIYMKTYTGRIAENKSENWKTGTLYKRGYRSYNNIGPFWTI